MPSKLLCSLAGLLLGIGMSVFPRTAEAIRIDCNVICDALYDACVADRGLKAGCGRERRECLRLCA